MLNSNGQFQHQTLQAHMETWVPHLAQHMTSELDTLKPEYMDKVGKEVYVKSDKATLKHLQSFDPAWFLCAAFGENDLTRGRKHRMTSTQLQ